MTISRLFSVLLFAALLFAPRLVLADEAAARIHFKRGIDLYDKKNYVDALAEFDEAYKEKPSAGIRQNIALCLKGMGKPVEAATSFDDALEEGKTTLKPDTRAAIERELADLSRVVATLNIAVMTEDRRPVDGAVVSIEPSGGPARTLPGGASKRQLRLAPGVYTLTAKVPGFPDPPEKKLALVAGAPVDVTFVVGEKGHLSPGLPGQAAQVTVKPSRADATIKVDGVEVGKGTWTGWLPAGPHRVEASAPDWKTTSADITLAAGATVDVPLKMIAAAEAPGEYMAPTLKDEKRKIYYVAVSGGLDNVNYRLSAAMGEQPNGFRRNFFGASIGGRFGVAFHRNVAVELLAELGAGGNTYRVNPTDSADTETSIFHWQLTPGLRFMSPGRVRFTTGTGLGLHGVTITEKVPAPIGPLTRKGSGGALSWLWDLGAQFEAGPVFFEAVLFLDVHGVGAVKDDSSSHDRLLLTSPGVRGGLRLGLGMPF